MRIKRLVIKNAKAITFLDASLERPTKRRPNGTVTAPPIELICAPNGQGKTTLLEVMSLIGHIPCAKRVVCDAVGPNVSGSWADVHWQGDIDPVVPFKIKRPDFDRLDEWVEALPKPWLGAYFEVEDLHDGIGSLQFCMVLRTDEMKHASLTSLLSAKISDREFGENAFLIASSSTDLKVNAFVQAIARGRKFNPEINFDRSGPKRYVSYINTDMNDFGRGNDLRESPKTLTDDFGSEMVDRIGVPFIQLPADTKVLGLQHLDEIKEIMGRVLTTPRYRFSTPAVVSPSLEILDFEIREGTLCIRVRLQERHGTVNASDPIIENLSAGENETLFVFLMMLRFSNESSIILLDEPDLHVAGYMRPTLFREIFNLFNPIKQHLVIVSHSPSSISALRSFTFGRSERASGRMIQRRIKIRNHLRMLLKVHPEELKHAKFELKFDRGFLRTLQSGLLAGGVTWKGRFGLMAEEVLDARARFVSEMQKSNWAWYPFVGGALTLTGSCLAWLLVSVIVPPENVGDTRHVELVTWLERAITLASFAFIPTALFGCWKAVKSKMGEM